jgi:hypothetical protein
MDLSPSVDFDSFCAMYIAPAARAIALMHATAWGGDVGGKMMIQDVGS